MAVGPTSLDTLRVVKALDKIGTTIEFVLLDLRDATRNNPALQEALEWCESDEERLDLAFEWFRDHPQPTERSAWVEGVAYGQRTATVRTPTWRGPFPLLLEDEHEPKSEPGPPPELPKGVLAYRHATIKQAVTLFANGTTRNDVAKAVKLQPKDATRVRNLVDGGLLRLNEEGKLVVHPTVGRPRGLIVLRYHKVGHWFDPHDYPPPPRGAGVTWVAELELPADPVAIAIH
jgi:hypothetical protein